MIVSNTLIQVGEKLKNKKCLPFTSDLLIHIKSNGLYTYPDISVVCGIIEKADTPFDSVTNPVMIIEVLSETTKDYDRGSKFMLYRGLPSLKEYILIDSKGATHIEQFVKNEEDIWQLHEYQNMDDSLKIKSLDINIPLSDIYKDIYEQA